MPFSFTCFSTSFFNVNNMKRKITQAGVSWARLTQFQSLSAIPDPPWLHLAQTCREPWGFEQSLHCPLYGKPQCALGRLIKEFQLLPISPVTHDLTMCLLSSRVYYSAPVTDFHSPEQAQLTSREAEASGRWWGSSSLIPAQQILPGRDCSTAEICQPGTLLLKSSSQKAGKAINAGTKLPHV